MAKNPNRVAAGKKSKRKGSSNERRLAKLFKEWWGVGEFERTPSSGGWSSKAVREEFRTCGDIITTDPEFIYCIEAKKQESWELKDLILNDSPAILDFWDQTIDETPDDLFPLLVFCRNRVKDMILCWKSDAPEGFGKFKHFIYNNDKYEAPMLIMSLGDFLSIPKEDHKKMEKEPDKCPKCKKAWLRCECLEKSLNK